MFPNSFLLRIKDVYGRSSTEHIVESNVPHTFQWNPTRPTPTVDLDTCVRDPTHPAAPFWRGQGPHTLVLDPTHSPHGGELAYTSFYTSPRNYISSHTIIHISLVNQRIITSSTQTLSGTPRVPCTQMIIGNITLCSSVSYGS